MNKPALRAKYKFLRNELSKIKIEEKSIQIANNVLKMNIFDKTYFHLFLPIEPQNEVDTQYILNLLQGKDKEIVVSKSNFETREMTHFLLTDNTKFKINEYQIPEPVNGLEVPVNKIEVVFVPLLAFDKLGNRVGYGKGFYDKFFSQCQHNTIKIGLSFFEPEDLIEDLNENDVRLDYCVTPKIIFSF